MNKPQQIFKKMNKSQQILDKKVQTLRNHLR